ncbi:hypothetical protein J6590_093057 [Homalodisca vitripennis]|nr:hypothetical protein J6590_093057 [Homalodisca vitripennis]
MFIANSVVFENKSVAISFNLVYTTGEDSVMTLECHRRTLSLELECVTSVALTMTSEVEEVIAPDNARLCHNQGDWYTSRQLG